MAKSTLNKNMIEGQIKPINGMSEELLSIFYSLDRIDFMPESIKEMSYIEKNIVIQDKKEEKQTSNFIKKRKISRNEPCSCGSGKKYKHCHGKVA